jgi:hypothetical protein
LVRTAAVAEKTSAAPLPKASSVTPATESLIPQFCAIVLMLGTTRESSTNTRFRNRKHSQMKSSMYLWEQHEE